LILMRKRVGSRCPSTEAHSLLDDHLRNVQPLSSSSPTLVVLNLPGSGVGDQLSAFLGALTVAVGTRRRLELLPDATAHTSYLAAAFELPFDAAYSGETTWVDDAQLWLRDDYPHLRPNLTYPQLQRLPRLQRESWGVTVTNDQPALAARLLVPSPSGVYPPMHHTILVRRHELLVGGNVGSTVFRSYFQHLQQQQRFRPLKQKESGSSAVSSAYGPNTTASPSRNEMFGPAVVSCLLQRLLRPSTAVLSLVEQLRPWTAASGTSSVVGVHIRAEAHLINRKALTEDARYLEMTLRRSGGGGAAIYAADRVFADCAPTGAPSLRHDLHDFGEYWVAASAASHWLRTGEHAFVTTGGRARLRGSEARRGTDALTEVSSHLRRPPRRQRPMPQRQLRWLVVSDSSPLKHDAHAAWPEVVRATSLVATQVWNYDPFPAPHRSTQLTNHATQVGYCDTAMSSRRSAVLQTVAELLLLAEAHVLVLGRSRFGLAALLLSGRCVLALHVHLDRACLRNRARLHAAKTTASLRAKIDVRQWMAAPPLLRLPHEWGDVESRELVRRKWFSSEPSPDRGRARSTVLRCIGTDDNYSVRRFHDADGSLLDGDGFLSNF